MLKRCSDCTALQTVFIVQDVHGIEMKRVNASTFKVHAVRLHSDRLHTWTEAETLAVLERHPALAREAIV